MKVKETTNQVTTNAKRVVTNGEQFVQAVALLTVAGFSYWALGKVQVPQVGRVVVLVALVIIGLRGTVEFIKFLNKE